MKSVLMGKKPIALLVLVTFLMMPMVMGNALAAPIIENSQIAFDVSPLVAEQLINKVLQLDEFEQASSEYELDVNNIKVKQFSKQFEDKYTVGIPIKDNTGINASYFIVFFDYNQNFEGTLLNFFNKKDNDNYHYLAKTEKAIVQADITEAGEILAGYAVYEDGTKVDLKSLEGTDGWSDWWECMDDCMSSMGIPQWLIGAIAVACAAICVITVGTGCIACIAAMVYAEGFDLGACVTLCSGWAD